MTVKELIEKLQALPQDMPVYRYDFEWSVVPLRSGPITVTPEPEHFTGKEQPPGILLK